MFPKQTLFQNKFSYLFVGMVFLCDALKTDVCSRAKRVSVLSFAIVKMRCDFTNATKLGACMSMCGQQTHPICQGVTFKTTDLGTQNCGICSINSSSALVVTRPEVHEVLPI